jgi:hypothetical protein
MKAVLPDADVQGHRALIAGITLPDPNDRHVIAAALVGGASVIVTWNVRHFPAKVLAGVGLTRQDPDAFLCDLLAAKPEVTVAAAAHARRNLRRSAPTAEAFLEALQRQGLARFTARLQAWLADL